MNSGAKWRDVLLSDIRKRDAFTITHPRFDALTGITSPATETWEITDAWRRAFDIGVGTAEGTSQDNPEQVHANAVVRARLGGGGGGMGGFDAAEAIQFERTKRSQGIKWEKVLVKPSLTVRVAASLEKPRFASPHQSISPRVANVAQVTTAVETSPRTLVTPVARAKARRLP